jgi:hypothetical protein
LAGGFVSGHGLSKRQEMTPPQRGYFFDMFQ